MDGNFDKVKAVKAQEEYCKTHSLPHFAPEDGVCWSCRRNIYVPIERVDGSPSGVTVEQAGSKLITGCPHCNRSYCD